jgi:8-amino-7-oxononanoate synthase
MPDFTSALFLDWRHESADLGGWSSLTTGRPAALGESPAAIALGRRIAGAQGAAAGVVHRSALHALIDILSLSARPGSVVFLDREAYPLARTAATGVAGTVPVGTFGHHDGVDLAAAVDRLGGRPVIVTDGWCTSCNRPAPLPELERIARDHGGLLVVDDTQGAGILGSRSVRHPPFGCGGGGTFRWLGAAPGDAIQVVSLAKAYGAPLAVTTGPERVVGRLAAYGTRSTSSPPSAADLAAASRATADERGNDLRRDLLARLVLRLRRGMRQLGLAVVGLAFPVVTVALSRRESAAALHGRLVRAGVHALLLHAPCLRQPAIAFAVTAGHVDADIDEALAALHAERRPWGAVR